MQYNAIQYNLICNWQGCIQKDVLRQGFIFIYNKEYLQNNNVGYKTAIVLNGFHCMDK